MLRTSSSLSCRKSSYAPPTAMNGSGVERQTTRSATDRSACTAWRAPTGTATTTAAGRVSSNGGDCRQHCGAGCQAIIHEDDGRISDIQIGEGKDAGATLKLKPLSVPRGFERLAADAQSVDDLLVAEF